MGIFERLRTTKAKERLMPLSRKFRELPFRTKVIIGAVGLGLVLVLILVLLPGGGGGEKGVLLVEEPVSAAQGGSIASSDGRIALQIPPGALAEDTTVSIRLLSEEEWTDDIKDLSPVGPVYSLEPDGLTFQEPVTLKLALDSSLYSVGPDGIEVTVPILYTTDTNGQPEPLQDTEIVVSPEEAYIQGKTTHFSLVWERQGTVEVIMNPGEVKLLACPANFDIDVRVFNFSASEMESVGGFGWLEPTNLTEVSLRPVARPAVTSTAEPEVELFYIPSGGNTVNVFTYRITGGEGSYGAVLVYNWSYLDTPEAKNLNVITIWGKATCPPAVEEEEEETPPVSPPACPEGSVRVNGECVPCGEGSIVVGNECVPCGEGSTVVGNECVPCECTVGGECIPCPEIVINITHSTGVVARDAVIISITGLTPNGDFTKTVCSNGDCNSYNLTADGFGNFEDTLIPYIAGTMTVTVVDGTTGETAEFSFEVAEAPPDGGTSTATTEAAENPGDHPVLIPNEILVGWGIVDGIITITGIPGVDVLTGVLGADGTFIATGEGTYAGFLTTFIFDGYITPEGFFGLLIIGSEGGLPDALAIIYFILFFFV